MTFTPLAEVEWRKVGILKRPDGTYEHEFWLPEPQASWGVYDAWERERFHSMRDNLARGDVLFDIGAEHGWCSLVYASYVGPENMVLVEPTAAFWPNIKATWERNYTERPRGFFDGFFSDKTTFVSSMVRCWPDACANPLIDRGPYASLNGSPAKRDRVDDFVRRSEINPTALTIDVEGAELLVLRGAENTLRTLRPKVWVSVHPEMLERDYGTKASDVLQFMNGLGYEAHHLADDHEIHVYFSPIEDTDV